jgi:Type II CAAX prenyl endopeptidase Rce1-like
VSSSRHDAAEVRATARAAFFGILTYAAARFAGAYLDQYAVAAAVVQAVIAEYGAGRLGIAWSDPHAPPPAPKAIALRALRGAGMGLTAALVGLGVALGTKAASLAPNTPDATVAVVNLVPPLALAARDELLLRGVMLRVRPSNVAPWVRLAVCGLASAAAAYGEGVLSPAGLAAAGLGGVACGALWLKDRGAWLAWAAHAAFLWACTTLGRGAILDVRAAPNGWGGGDAWLASGGSAVLSMAIVCAGALLIARGALSPKR